MENTAVLYNIQQGVQGKGIEDKAWSIEQLYIIYSMEHTAMLYNIQHEE